MIYGYPEKVVDEEHGLLQLREVTLAMTSEQLRLVARFLAHVATELESGAPFSHRHIAEVVPEWESIHPGVDIIGSPPIEAEFPEIAF